MEDSNKKNTATSILFVDSDPQINRISKGITENEVQLNLIFAKDAKEALVQLAKQQISLVILEIILPIVSGYFLINDIQKNHPDTPIIIYTRLKKPQDLAKMAASGASNIYLKELLSIDQLLQKIKQGETTESIDKTVIKLNEQIRGLMEAEGNHIQKMIQCSKCHLIVPPDSRFCNNCGQQIEKKAQKKLLQKNVEANSKVKQ